MTLTEPRLRGLLAWVVIVLAAGPVASAVALGVAHGDSPCILCWAQRTSMALIALTGLFVLRYGPRPRYLALTLLLGTWGAFMALRHSALHLARDVGQGFSAPILGLHTYTWSLIVHVVVLAVTATLLFVMDEVRSDGAPRELTPTGRFAAGLFVVVVAANALQAIVSTGPPPFIGQADPVRFSINPKHWVWGGHEELEGALSLRGAWTIPEPTPFAADPDPARGPISGLTALQPAGEQHIALELDGKLTDLAYDAATGRFLAVTDRYGVYLLDSTLAHGVRRVVLDRGFAVDLSPLAGAAFLGDTLAVMSTNKSYVLLRPDSAADEAAMWRHFLATSRGVTELRRSRLATVRARQMYALALAFDPAAQELITVTVPSPRHRRLVVSRFARRDWLLSSEFEPQPGAGVTLDSGRALADYVVTGAAVDSGMLYLVSAAYSTVLVVDLASRELVAAYAVPGLARPVGIAVRGAQLLLAQEDGRITAWERPAR